MLSTATFIQRAFKAHTMVPSFNIPYLPMMEPIIRALRDTNTFGLIAVARLEWEKFSSGSLRAVYEEYLHRSDGIHTRLHLDHVPVIDEDGLRVDYVSIIQAAIKIGYESVMVDGSRLPLEENIAATRTVVEMAHAAGIAVETELGAVLGHESGPMPPYEELFATGKGFTSPEDAGRLVKETGVDWLSIAIGNIHGAISGAAKDAEKPEARLHIEHLKKIAAATGIPLVLHGGSGIKKDYLLQSYDCGIAKINVGIGLRQPYESNRKQSIPQAQEAVYVQAVRIINDELGVAGSMAILNSPRKTG